MSPNIVLVLVSVKQSVAFNRLVMVEKNTDGLIVKNSEILVMKLHNKDCAVSRDGLQKDFVMTLVSSLKDDNNIWHNLQNFCHSIPSAWSFGKKQVGGHKTLS